MNINRLKEIRENRDLKQKDIANILGIKQQQYSEYEISKRLIPITYLSNLADFYDTSIDYLLSKTDIRKPYKKSILEKRKHKVKKIQHIKTANKIAVFYTFTTLVLPIKSCNPKLSFLNITIK